MAVSVSIRSGSEKLVVEVAANERHERSPGRMNSANRQPSGNFSDLGITARQHSQLQLGCGFGPTLFLHPNLANQETETLADRRRRQIYREVLSPSFQLRPRGLTLGPPAKERISRPDRL